MIERWSGQGGCSSGIDSERVNGEAAKMTLYFWPGRKSVGGGFLEGERSCLICFTLSVFWQRCD